MKNLKLCGEYFCGNKASDYAIENGYLDYLTFSKAFDNILNNDIINKTSEIGYWEMVQGNVDNSDEISEIEEKIDDLNNQVDKLNELIERTDSKIDDIQEEIEEIGNDDSLESYEKGIELLTRNEDMQKLQDELSDLQSDLEELEEQISDLENEIELLKEQEYEGKEIYQYYIVSDMGAKLIEDYTNDVLFYNEELDIFVWGVSHWGTSWDYVLTDIKLNCGNDAFK